MNLERLNRLSEFLRNEVPNEHFNMDVWECGTYACALGWACRIPEFNEAGLHMPVPSGLPMCNDYVCYEAGMQFFDIDARQSRWLFSPNHYLNRKANEISTTVVADRIDDLMCEEITKNELGTAEPTF